jgi:hypothetical protein
VKRKTVVVKARFKIDGGGAEYRRIYRWLRTGVGFQRDEANAVMLGYAMGHACHVVEDTGVVVTFRAMP